MNQNIYGLKITSKSDACFGLTTYRCGTGQYALEITSSKTFEVGQTLNVIDGKPELVASQNEEVDDTPQFDEIEQTHEISREAAEGDNYRYEGSEF